MEMLQIAGEQFNHPMSLRIPEDLTSGYKPGKSKPVMVLNASPDVDLRGTRARFLNSAGYYTSSASTPEDVSKLASHMNCALAVMCHSFTGSEQRAMHERLRKISPTTRIVWLDQMEDCDPAVFLAKVKNALTASNQR